MPDSGLKDVFGHMPDGEPVHRFRLANDALRVHVLELGAVVQSIEVPNRDGERANVVLGLTTLDDYRTLSPHFGAVPGRCAGRIAKGRFVLDGVAYQLALNNGGNAIHGGPNGFGRRVWTARDHGPTYVELHLRSPDGEEGYPGEVNVVLRYSLQGSALQMDIEATTTRPTILNLTNHSYFNLGGEGSGSILGHVLWIGSDVFLPIDPTNIPTGEQRDVTGTAFDFRSPKRIGTDIHEADPQILRACGYDQAYLLSGSGLRHVATLYEPRGGRRLMLWTTEPALQLYTANMLTGTLAGPSGRTYRQTDAVCLEAQHPPDSPNQPGVHQAILRPGNPFRSCTIFGFDTIGAEQSL